MTSCEGPKLAPYELPKVPAQHQELLNIKVRAIEELFTVGPDGTTALAPTGDLYEVYGCDGPRGEGAMGQYFDLITGRWRPGGTIHLAPETAINAFVDMMTNLRRRLRGKPTLYWRTRPELGHFYRVIESADGMSYRLPVWDIYARFLATHQPPLED